MKDQKANKFLAIAVALIAVLALVVAFGAHKSAKQLDRGTPEGAVQEYLSAVIAGDFDGAAKRLDPEGSCKSTDLDKAYFQSDVRISLINSTETSTGAVVRIQVEMPNGAPIAGYYGEEHTLRLVKGENGWMIAGIPWPMYECGGVIK
jgi:hypothetical protein